jgi:hypothetical protein
MVGKILGPIYFRSSRTTRVCECELAVFIALGSLMKSYRTCGARFSSASTSVLGSVPKYSVSPQELNYKVSFLASRKTMNSPFSFGKNGKYAMTKLLGDSTLSQVIVSFGSLI